ncbi:aminoglycoside N(3)-acetyltransferase [Campylobacter jejuni]|nr:aminoglycoside N(3)-acetyltransferase [Campylobacter jejuni]
MKELFQYNQKIYTQKDLTNALENIGIKNGDIICVHSEIYNFGIPLLPIKDFLNALLECLFEVIGKEGTLIMPTFTYSFCKNEVYDKLNSKCTVGALNEFFRKQQGVKRTNDPIFSFAVKGFKENIFLKNYKSCFGSNSVFDKLTKHKGKVVLFGNKHLGITYTHYIEETMQVSYRYYKIFKGKTIDENKKIKKKEIIYFVRDLNQHSIANRNKILNICEKNNISTTTSLGGAEILALQTELFFKYFTKIMKRNEKIML